MPIISQKWIMRQDLVNNRGITYVFGDNCNRLGMGGQAKEMRGEPNSFGIPTKWTPGHSDADFFYDEQVDKIAPILADHFHTLSKLLKDGSTVIFPTDGIGTGLSELPQRAPKLDRHIKATVVKFFSLYGVK